jgi:hypothetical protein
MTSLKYTLTSYQTYLGYSQEKHLLVEGRDDKRVFSLLLDELFEQTSSQDIETVLIDSAEDLVEFEDAGNREKIERVCESIATKSYAKRIVGFVDREFREFGRNPCFVDRIGGHRVSDRLVWSRGHSIENYYFDFDTLRSPLRVFSVTDRFREALELFGDVFEQTLRLACAASLTGNESGRLSLVKGSISRDVLEIELNEKIRLLVDSDVWETNLIENLGANREITDQLMERFHFWSDRVEDADFEVVRWMCHGHIGLAFIWAAYSACVSWICQQHGYGREDAESEARRVLKAEESVRFNACAEKWVKRALGDQCSYPLQVLELLGLNTLIA